MCLHGRMKQEIRLGIYSQFCESRSVLFSTDVASRGLDFNKAVDWVVQVDCPEDVASYIHRVGRTARYLSGGRSILFLMPSEMKMLEKLQAAKVPIQFIKANTKRLEPVSRLLSALLVKYPNMQQLAQRAFITYLRSIYIQKDNEIFDVTKLPIDDYSASLGLPMTPTVRFLNRKKESKIESEKSTLIESETFDLDNESAIAKGELLVEDFEDNKEDKDFLLKDAPDVGEGNASEIGDIMPATRVLKKKKLKINVHRPVGTRVVFDEEGNTQAPLAMLAEKISGEIQLDEDKKNEFYKKMREELKQVDKGDKLLQRQRLREERMKKKMKLKKGQRDDDEEVDVSDSGEPDANKKRKRSKIYFHSDSEDEKEEIKVDSAGVNADSISLAEQEELALKLLNSMHS
ncbi:DEAD-box ATP-dependent RNA helicase 32 [Hibiscus syriacus]|uniref:ATP-dependent RNA helicase n=2 Tax=Hibiscus syriacus TaxID=106335 RepID=A0A6A3BB36_HIBSY|nr:DEAD-box ATP-dependent RNA helicase 32 [Hibiscus syriacus]